MPLCPLKNPIFSHVRVVSTLNKILLCLPKVDRPLVPTKSGTTSNCPAAFLLSIYKQMTNILPLQRRSQSAPGGLLALKQSNSDKMY